MLTKLLFLKPNTSHIQPTNGVWKQTLYPATDCTDDNILVIFIVDADEITFSQTENITQPTNQPMVYENKLFLSCYRLYWW